MSADVFSDENITRMRGIIHEEIVKYHFYGVRHTLVQRRNDANQQLVLYLQNPLEHEKIIKYIQRDMKQLDKSIAECEETIERVGKFDTRI